MTPLQCGSPLKGESSHHKKEGWPVRERPNVILIVLDTLRADHLGCYGYFRDTSPNLDRLAKEGILFKDA
ncbi:MAG TPA: hypothetical protein EYP65_07340, partial [Armatimonadetes bacterium]|nr:hypothetical protein [Armatimonadota bacterium]